MIIKDPDWGSKSYFGQILTGEKSDIIIENQHYSHLNHDLLQTYFFTQFGTHFFT